MGVKVASLKANDPLLSTIVTVSSLKENVEEAFVKFHL